MEKAERLEIRPAVFQTCQATRENNACILRVLFTHVQLECLCCQRLKMTRRKASTQCLVRSAVYYLFIRQKQRWAKSFFLFLNHSIVFYRHRTSHKLQLSHVFFGGYCCRSVLVLVWQNKKSLFGFCLNHSKRMNIQSTFLPFSLLVQQQISVHDIPRPLHLDNTTPIVLFLRTQTNEGSYVIQC
jgi:hypothetical protein